MFLSITTQPYSISLVFVIYLPLPCQTQQNVQIVFILQLLISKKIVICHQFQAVFQVQIKFFANQACMNGMMIRTILFLFLTKIVSRFFQIKIFRTTQFSSLEENKLNLLIICKLFIVHCSMIIFYKNLLAFQLYRLLINQSLRIPVQLFFALEINFYILLASCLLCFLNMKLIISRALNYLVINDFVILSVVFFVQTKYIFTYIF